MNLLWQSETGLVNVSNGVDESSESRIENQVGSGSGRRFLPGFATVNSFEHVNLSN